MPFDPYTNRLWQIESGGNPYNRTGSNRGLSQFGPQEERMYGINDNNRHDPAAQAAALDRERTHHTGILSQALGRDPTPGELYLMHQQGIAGGPALLNADPSTPAWRVIRPFYGSDYMAQKAITGNIGPDSPLKRMNADQISAGGFSAYWKDKFENRLPAGYQMASAEAPPIGGSPSGLPMQPEDQAGGLAYRMPTGQSVYATPGMQMAAGGPTGSPAQAALPSGGLFGSQLASTAAPGAGTADPYAALTKMGMGMLQAPQMPAVAPMQLPPFQPLQMARPQVDYSGLQRLLAGRSLTPLTPQTS